MRHNTCSIRTRSLSSLSLSKRSRSSFCLSISSLCRSRRRFSRSSRSRCSCSVISRRLGGGVDKIAKWNIQETFAFHTSTYLNNTTYYLYYLTILPAHLCSSTGALHPLLHSLFLHLLKWQDVFIFVGKRTLPALHHLKLGQAGDKCEQQPTDKTVSYKLCFLTCTILGGISHFGLGLCIPILTKGWKKRTSYIIIHPLKNVLVTMFILYCIYSTIKQIMNRSYFFKIPPSSKRPHAEQRIPSGIYWHHLAWAFDL